MLSFHLKAILYDAKNDLKYRDVAPLKLVTRVFPLLAHVTCFLRVPIGLIVLVIFVMIGRYILFDFVYDTIVNCCSRNLIS